MALARKWATLAMLMAMAMASSIAIWRHSKRRNCVKRLVAHGLAKLFGNCFVYCSLNVVRSNRMAVPVAPIQRQCVVSL